MKRKEIESRVSSAYGMGVELRELREGYYYTEMELSDMDIEYGDKKIEVRVILIGTLVGVV